MIKQDLIQRVVERTGLVRTKAEAAVDAIFEAMKQSLVEGRLGLGPDESGAFHDTLNQVLLDHLSLALYVSVALAMSGWNVERLDIPDRTEPFRDKSE